MNFFPDPKKYSQPKPKKGLSRERKPTGELVLFKEIYVERKGTCEITGTKIEFHPMSFLHVLSKGAYVRFRLYKKNIVLVIPEIHDLYDNGTKEHLLSVYPGAKKIYELKDELKTEYYSKGETI